MIADTNILFMLGFIISLVESVAIIILILNLVVMRYSKDYNVLLQPSFKRAMALSNSQIGQYLEDFIVICIALSVSLYTLARVISGQCDENLSMWSTQVNFADDIVTVFCYYIDKVTNGNVEL